MKWFTTLNVLAVKRFQVLQRNTNDSIFAHSETVSSIPIEH